MKKLYMLLAVLLIIVITGCSGGKADTPTPIPTPTPVTPSIKVDGFTAILNSQYTESIVIAINENFALSHFDWQVKAQTMLNEMNAALNRTAGNKKQYTVGKFMTFPDTNVESMYANGPDGSYYIDNGYTRCGGTTVFFYLYNGTVNMPSFFMGMVNGFRHLRTASDGRILEEVWIPYDISNSPFTNLTQGTLDYEIAVNALRHEFGHTLGLAAEEWYRYEFKDFTGLLPDLGTYSRQTQFPADPMDAGVQVPPEFAPLNSWIINKNANHQYNAEEIVEGIPAVIKVKVIDNANNPINGATVKVFAALWGSVPVTDPILLLNVTTNINGEAIINSDDAVTSTYGGVTHAHGFGISVSAKIVKVESGGKVAGAFLTLTDLEIAYLQNDLDTLVIELKPE